MGRALEMIGLSVTAAGATLTAMTPGTGNSLTVRRSKGAKIVAIGGKRQGTAGQFRVRSPLLHDSTIGIDYLVDASTSQQLVLMAPQPLESQDTLQASATGSATAGDIDLGWLCVSYDDLDGVDGRFIDTAALRRRAVNAFTKRVAIVATAAGGWTGSTTINNADDYFKADTDYAIQGVIIPVNGNIGAVRIVGPDWGNLGIGVPSLTGDRDIMGRYFCELSDQTREPLIPIFNSSNRSQITLSVLSDENAAGTVTVSVVMAELRRTRS